MVSTQLHCPPARPHTKKEYQINIEEYGEKWVDNEGFAGVVNSFWHSNT